MNRWLGSLALLVLLLASAEPAAAGCTITSLRSTSPGIVNLGSYSMLTVPSPTTVLLVIDVADTGNGIGSCKSAIAISRASAPLQMLRPGSSLGLPYMLTIGGQSIVTFGGAPPTLVALPLPAAPRGTSTATLTIPLVITPLAPVTMPPGGVYSDLLSVSLYDVQGSRSTYVGGSGLSMQGVVQQSCSAVAVGALALDFTSDIVNGVPAGRHQTISFSVNCSAPSRVQLTGGALAASTSGAASPGFDAIINYKAVATFAGARAALTTQGTTARTAVSAAQSTATGNALPVHLNEHMLAGRPLLPDANYAAVLNVSIDPSM